ncbi:MAG: hypothetical protein K2L93_07410 [Muribaculaceae bacterium]|nr:hypothetical protein [Muribaculaceae bacterium]MDE6322110.1 hypothetical protein [Muribaculaceae bacterium]
MTRLRQYINAPGRYKRSRGYGVHSPFAFYFIRRVLCERTPYYDYEAITTLRQQALDKVRHIKGHSHVMSLKHAKMIYRILCHYKPVTMLQIGSTHGLTTATALLYDPKLHITLYDNRSGHNDQQRVSVIDDIEPILRATTGDPTTPPPFPVVVISDLRPEDRARVTTLLRRHTDMGGVTIVRNLSNDSNISELWRALTHTMERGMSFTNAKIGIITGDRDLPLHHYKLWF